MAGVIRPPTIVPPPQARPRGEDDGAAITRSRAKCEKIRNPDKYVTRRIVELGEALRASTYENLKTNYDYITMAAAVAEDERGCSHKLISSSHGDEVRASVQTLAPQALAPIYPDEVPIVDGDGHAEMNIINSLRQKNWQLKALGATRRICRACEAAIRSYGVEPITRLVSEDFPNRK
jgi:hypothetical protein